MTDNIDYVRQFWESNPLWTGESSYDPGTKEFFEEHRKVVVEDCFAGYLDERLFPGEIAQGKVLDLGSSPGFWTVELALRGGKNILSVDLTQAALERA